ncbi:glycosyltransferase [Vibrio sp. MA40-2]|uniref:glycosyltransferase n=1 Tax=Vibrio sp. MA40-2 TaxID=3391828 RepID=UPI0039A4F4E5
MELNTHVEPFFSVVIPTRNRPELFKLALDSVLSQKFDRLEVIIVNDGSTEEFLGRYQAIETAAADNVTFCRLVHRPNGHGQSYSMNYGVHQAKGQYVCFLDDDDFWIDDMHLQKAYDSISSAESQVDAYYTNQDAYFADGSKQTNNVWIEDLQYKLTDQTCDSAGSYQVDLAFLLSSQGFAHLNCSIVRKELYQLIGGMDENIRYECDRDIYNRTIDAADNILYNPAVISKHHIPDVSKKDNMSTLVSFSEKLIYQLRVYEKGIALSKNEQMVKYCATGNMYILKRLAQGFYERQDIKRAAYFARQALGLKFTPQWFAFSMYLTIMSFKK